MDIQRSARFCDADSTLVSYFSNDHGVARMDMVRHAIIEIRENWEQRHDAWMTALRQKMFPDDVASVGDSDFVGRVNKLFTNRRNWLDPLTPGARGTVNTDAIWLYTSSPGYDRMFQSVYRIFRTTGPVWDDVLLATFLVELLNIDLYNFWSTNTSAQNFNGIVYRGMAVSAETLGSFEALATLPLGKRAFSIPLAVNSSSTAVEATFPFMSNGLLEHPTFIPVLCKIHVAGLSAERQELYERNYRGSVVSTICAVPIEGLSAYPNEAEVLLRGPFFEFLGIEERPALVIGDKPVRVMEMMMMNSNRDHPSTPQSGPKDPARLLFNSLVRAQKFERCAQIVAEAGRSSDSRSLSELAARADDEASKFAG
jgi:hypothetical protein